MNSPRRFPFSISIAVLGCVVSTFCSVSCGQQTNAFWIWNHSKAATLAEVGGCYFRKTIELDRPSNGTIEVAADDQFELFLNGRRVGSGNNWQYRYQFDVSRLLLPGRNVVGVAVANSSGNSAGLVAKISVSVRGGANVVVATDTTWKVHSKPQGTWASPDSDDSLWQLASSLGVYGTTAPWGAPGKVVAELPADLPNRPRVYDLGRFEFQQGDRVTLLGSAFIERLQFGGAVEAAIVTAFPHRRITFRNLGWSGDTVWGDARAVFGTREDGFRRLVRDVADTNPTVIIACYGENEAFAGEAGLDEYRSGLEQLLDNLERTGARIVLLGPRKHEAIGAPFPDPAPYNRSLRKYSDVTAAVANSREHAFIDLYELLPSDASNSKSNLTDNGFHFLPAAQALVARELAQRLGAAKPNWDVHIDAASGQYRAVGTLLSDLVATTTRVEFSSRSRTLSSLVSALEEGEYRLRSATQLRISKLEEGEYELLVDGKSVRKESNTRWEIGVSGIRWDDETQWQQVANLLEKKDELYFHRYRPQNETYLFLFRKHEQGNNAVEIPQFDPLVERIELQVESLALPPIRKFQLRRVSN